jgi:hypothetical protein
VTLGFRRASPRVIIGLGVVGVMVSVHVPSVCGVQNRDPWVIPCLPLVISLLFCTNPCVQ